MKDHQMEISKIFFYGQDILQTPEFARAMQQRHHIRTSVGQHSIQVALRVLSICRAFRRKGLSVDERLAVRGALLHDLGILDRERKFKNSYECSQLHPVESARLAARLVEDYDERLEHIIVRHMWPVTPDAPHSLEGIAVNLGDKWAAVTDLVPDRKEKLRRMAVLRAMAS